MIKLSVSLTNTECGLVLLQQESLFHPYTTSDPIVVMEQLINFVNRFHFTQYSTSNFTDKSLIDNALQDLRRLFRESDDENVRSDVLSIIRRLEGLAV